MIEPNKYTDETIHVANWLIGTGEAARLLELARQDAAIYDAEVFAERLRECLTERIDERLIGALGECFPNHCETSVIWIDGVGHSPACGFYQDATAEDLFLPFVGQAIAGLELADVAEIILALSHPLYGDVAAAVVDAVTGVVAAHDPS
jgi:hypothetical protein